jgi:hypothetical protein
MPTRLFRKVGYVAVVAAATIGAMVYYSLTVLWPSVIGSLYTTDVVQIGLQSSVVGGGILLGQLMGGFALSYIPKVKIQVIVLTCMVFAFATALVCIDANSHATTIALGTLACICTGYVDNITFPAVTLLWEPQDIGLATGVLGSIRALGGAVAQAVYVTILTNKVTEYLPEEVTPAAIKAGLPSSSLTQLYAGITAGSFTSVPGINNDIIAAVSAAVKEAYARSFHMVFYATIPFSALFILSAIFVPNMEKYLHQNVAKRLQGVKGDDGNHPIPRKETA